MATAETVVLTLQEQISGPAEAAAGALSLLEQKILRDQAAIDRLQVVLGRAQAKLEAIKTGEGKGFVDVAAYQRQESAVNSLQNRISGARMRIQAAVEAQAAKESAAAEKVIATEQAAASRRMAIAATLAAQSQAAAERKASAEAAAADRAAFQAEAAAQRKAAAEAAAADRASKEAERAAAAEITAAKKVVEERTKASEQARQAQDKVKAAMQGAVQAVFPILGPVGESINKFFQLGKAIAQLPPQLQLVAVAIVAAAASLFALGKFFVAGIQASGQYRDEMLKLAGALEGNTSAAKELQGTISAVSSASATSRDKITGFATSLAKAGLQGAELRNALEAAAIASSAGGDQMAGDFLKSAEAAKKAGQSVDELSKKMKDKLGGVAAAQALSFGVQVEKLKENLTGLFSGADITPLLTAMQALLSIFDATSASGQSMKTTIGAAIEGLIGIVLQAGIAMLKLYIAVKQNETAWGLIKMAALGVAVVFGLLTAALGIVVAGIAGAGALIAGPFVAAAGLVVEMISAIASAASSLWSAITSPIQTAKAWLSSLSLSSIGTDLIMGLINGIVGAGGGIGSSLTNIVKSGIAAAKAALGIASPSRVFADIGMNTGAGMVQGLDASADSVEESTSGLADAAITGAAAGKKAAGALAGGASSDVKGFAPTFSNCNFVGTTQREIEAMMRAVFEAEYLDSGAMA